MAEHRTVLGPAPCHDCREPLLLVEPTERNSRAVVAVARRLGYTGRPPRTWVEAADRQPHRCWARVPKTHRDCAVCNFIAALAPS